jgi:hypothetical protein
MSAATGAATGAAAATVDVELPDHGPTGDVRLILLVDVRLVEAAATTRTGVGQRGFVDLVDAFGRRWWPMAVSAVLVAGLATGSLGLGLGWAFGEGSGLTLAGPSRGFELLTQFVGGALQGSQGAFELFDAGVETLVLGHQIVVGRSSHAGTSTERTTVIRE